MSAMLRKLASISFFFIILSIIFSFHPVALADTNWLNPEWLYRKEIIVNNTTNPNSLTNYQIKLTLNSTNFDFSKVKTQGEDLRFTDSDCTSFLNYWIESFDSVG